MQTIILERETVNFDGLFAELRAALGADVTALTTGRGQVMIHLASTPTPEQAAQLRQIVRDHDSAALTPDQQAENARRANAGDARTRFKASALANRTPEQIQTALAAQINGWASLADAKRDLAVWLPLLASALAWLVVEEER